MFPCVFLPSSSDMELVFPWVAPRFVKYTEKHKVPQAQGPTSMYFKGFTLLPWSRGSSNTQ